MKPSKPKKSPTPAAPKPMKLADGGGKNKWQTVTGGVRGRSDRQKA